MDEIRDKKGRLLPGHPGLKKSGDIKITAKEIKEKVAEFLNTRAGELDDIWTKLKPRQKAQMFVDLVPYLVPKQKEITVDFDESERKRMADLFPPELCDPEYGEREALKEKLLAEYESRQNQNEEEK